MGLLSKAEKRRAELLERVSKTGEKYLDKISKDHKKALFDGIRKQREQIAGAISEIRAEKPRVEWTPEMSVNEETIDAQHRKLIGQLNDLIIKSKEKPSADQLNQIRKLIDFFEKYAQEHFSYEEKYMEKNKFPKLKMHQKIHGGFVNFFKKFNSEFDKIYKSGDKLIAEKLKKLSEDAKRFLAMWLIHHILKEDRKYAVFISKTIETKKSKGEITLGKKERAVKSNIPDISEIAAQITKELEGKKTMAEPKKISGLKEGFVYTGISGFDQLLDSGIPKGISIIIAGGAGSGKTIFCLQTLMNKAREGKKCLYLTLEEPEERLLSHMEGFGWKPKELVRKGKLKIIRMNPFDITRNVDAMLAKEKGELLIDVDPVIIPEDFKPDFIVVDSLTAIASAFTSKEESYRIYIEQLFRFLERIGATSLLITETEQVPKIYSTTGVEEFLADGVVVLYNIKHGDVRENALEILKLRGASHQKKIVAFQITSQGLVVYPEQEVFSDMG
jgi:hemerythrin-like metal-binding protein